MSRVDKSVRVCAWIGATLSGWRNRDGLCRELLVKIPRVRLGGNLRLKRWDKLFGGERETKNVSEQWIASLTAVLLMTNYKVHSDTIFNYAAVTMTDFHA